MFKHTRSTLLWRTSLVAVICFVIVQLISQPSVRGSKVDTEAMLDASVSIKTISHVRIDEVGDSVWESGSGSGFLVSSDTCEVWTNHHVVDNAAVISVFPRASADNAGIVATVFNSTPRNDIAILRLDHCDGIPEAVLGDSRSVRPGDETYAVGNPLGHNPDSISRGIISHTQRFVQSPTPFLQTDAAINPGNSGGALFNTAGEVIGINTAIAASKSGSNIGIGYAIPIDVARTVAAELRDGPPSWGDAGLEGKISTLTVAEAAVFRVPGHQSAVILTTTPAEGPGKDKLFLHDVVYRIAGHEVSSVEQALRLVSNLEAGVTVPLDLVREGRLETVEITLAEGWQADDDHGADYYAGYLGMSLEMWNNEESQRGRFDHPVITKVHSLGPAHRAHIASSQRTFGFRGPFMVAFQLDVKTVTGVVLDGTYHAVSDVDELQSYARDAFHLGAPLLLEIELWTRENPMNVEQPLEPRGTAFFRLDPQLTTAMLPGVLDGEHFIDDGPVIPSEIPSIDDAIAWGELLAPMSATDSAKTTVTLSWWQEHYQ